MNQPNEPATWNWLDNLPEELALTGWVRFSLVDDFSGTVGASLCPYCSGFFHDPQAHIQRSKDCMVALTEAVEELRRKRK